MGAHWRTVGAVAVFAASLVAGAVLVADDDEAETRVVAAPSGSTTTFPPPEALTEPPVTTLRSSAGEVEGARQYYVWHQGPSLFVGPPPSPPTEALVVRRGEKLTVSHTVDAQPTELKVILTLADPSQGRDMNVPLTNPVTFTADFPTGVQKLSVFSQWGGEQFGAVLHEFMIDVQ